MITPKYIFLMTIRILLYCLVMNWTFMGLNDQSNQTIVQVSYGSSVIWEDSVQRFEDIWNNKAKKLTSFEFDADLADELLEKVNTPEYSDIEKFFESKQLKSLYYVCFLCISNTILEILLCFHRFME